MSAGPRTEVPRVAVVGSANLDVVVPVLRHPRLGETVIGGDHYRVPGGKGANQAVACARLGVPTAFIGCIGEDDVGARLRQALVDDRVDVAALTAIADAPSGLAMIVVDDSGENTIVVSPGANTRLAPAHLDAALLGGASAVLLQLEVPVPTVAAAATAATGLVVLNPAPATPLPQALLERADVLVPNRGELAVLAGVEREPTDPGEVADLVGGLAGRGRVVVTLGSEGALVVDDGEVVHVPAQRVDAVDATAAGDSFCAALTVALTEGASLQAAARWASRVAAVTVTRKGAQPSLPRREEVGHTWQEPEGTRS